MYPTLAYYAEWLYHSILLDGAGACVTAVVAAGAGASVGSTKTYIANSSLQNDLSHKWN